MEERFLLITDIKEKKAESIEESRQYQFLKGEIAPEQDLIYYKNKLTGGPLTLIKVTTLEQSIRDKALALGAKLTVGYMLSEGPLLALSRNYNPPLGMIWDLVSYFTEDYIFEHRLPTPSVITTNRSDKLFFNRIKRFFRNLRPVLIDWQGYDKINPFLKKYLTKLKEKEWHYITKHLHHILSQIDKKIADRFQTEWLNNIIPLPQFYQEHRYK